VNPATYEQYKVAAIQNVDLSLSYTLRGMVPGVKALKLQLNVFNLMNRQEVTSISPASSVAFDQYLFQAPRSFQVSAKADF
jgi:outer membrane receptor protein involved in Fe transport